MCEATMERVNVAYTNLSKRYSNENSNFTKQYCSIYNVRIERMRQILADRIAKKWDNEYPLSRLHELAEDNFPKCIIIGTLFKDQKLKPSVLKQLAEDNHLLPQPVHAHFTDESDILYIEDELQRYQLVGDLTAPKLVTGITCALLGYNMGKGKFMVEEHCFANYRTQIERPLMDDDVYVVFVSGLDFINIQNSLISLQLFSNWIAGTLGDFNDIEVLKITRLIIAGNSIRTQTNKDKQKITILTSRTVEAPETIEAVKTLDAFLLQMCQVIEVDIMPGEYDPSNYVLPQKSMHHCMFPNSSLYKSTNHVSNPYECDIGGVKIMGNSGQPVVDVLRFSEIKEPIDVLQSCLEWNHQAPTAPDTLGCFPFYDTDPFIIEDCPHVFFTANQEKFATKIAKGQDGQEVRIMSIPKFSSTFTACVLNLKNLDCVPITFKIV